MLSDPKANRAAYDVWRDKVRGRIDDPAIAEKLAPTEPPHPFGLKRASLEQSYFDIFNEDHVDHVDLKEAPIGRVTRTGIQVRTYQGLTNAGYPNVMVTYGPQAPTAFCNGPSSAEYQGDTSWNASSTGGNAAFRASKGYALS